jgi:2-polyprenyl-6-methoxyphenol hydroxylase-like FAD-dependent oxidoreductase
VHRGALFQALFEAIIQAGVEFQVGREVKAFDGAFVFADGKRSPRFDLSIDALGVRSPLRKAPGRELSYGALWANLNLTPAFDAAALEQRYERARKMAGVLPIGLGRTAYFWSLKGEDYNAWRARPLEAWKDDARMLWPTTGALLDQIHDHDALVFARYAHGTMRTPLSRGLVHIGDSAHCASPQLGQGANMGLLDALALARAVEVSGADMEAAGLLYARMRRWHIRLYQAASFLFTPAYQSDSAAASYVRDWIMSPISRVWPMPKLLAALVAGRLGGPIETIARYAHKP